MTTSGFKAGCKRKKKNLATRYITVKPLMKKKSVNILKATKEERPALSSKEIRENLLTAFSKEMMES